MEVKIWHRLQNVCHIIRPNYKAEIWYVIWYDMLWYDIIPYGIWYDIWYGMIYIWCDIFVNCNWVDTRWYDIIRYGMIWYDTIYGMIWYMIWYGIIWYDTMWYNNNIYLLQLGCHPVAVVISHVHTTWNWLLLNLTLILLMWRIGWAHNNARKEWIGRWDVFVTVHPWYNYINNQLDATITVY